MSEFLRSVGRARPTRTMLSVLEGKLAVNRDERRALMTNAELRESAERVNRMQRQNQLEQQQIEDMNRELPVDSLMDMMEGGAGSPMAKYAYDLAEGFGYINARGGIRKKDVFEMYNIINQPQNALKLANLRVQHYKNIKDQALEVLSQKPNDQKAVQAFNEATQMYNAAFEMVPGVKAELDRELEREKIAAKGQTTPGEVWQLSSGKTVISYDRGRTYKGEDGQNYAMPADAVERAAFTGEDVAMKKAQTVAKETLETEQPTTVSKESLKMAEQGTGLWAGFAAALDAVLGGLGIDRLVGAKGFFKDTQDARQKLRTIKQMGKPALLTSTRGAVYDQTNVDKLFPDPDKLIRNPRTEARKFKNLFEIMRERRRFYTEQIASGTLSTKETAKFRESVAQFDRLLLMIGMEENTPVQINTVEEYNALEIGTTYIDPDGNTRVKK